MCCIHTKCSAACCKNCIILVTTILLLLLLRLIIAPQKGFHSLKNWMKKKASVLRNTMRTRQIVCHLQKNGGVRFLPKQMILSFFTIKETQTSSAILKAAAINKLDCIQDCVCVCFCECVFVSSLLWQ